MVLKVTAAQPRKQAENDPNAIAATMNDLTKPMLPDLDGIPMRDCPPGNSMGPRFKNNIL